MFMHIAVVATSLAHDIASCSLGCCKSCKSSALANHFGMSPAFSVYISRYVLCKVPSAIEHSSAIVAVEGLFVAAGS